MRPRVPAGGCGFTVPASAGYIPIQTRFKAFHEGSVSHSSSLQPPAAALRVHRVTTQNGVREDPFYWLRDDTRSDPEVLAHLRAETAYADTLIAIA